MTLLNSGLEASRLTPIVHVAEWLTAGQVLPLVGLYIVVKAAEALLVKLLEIAVHREFLIQPLFGYQTTRVVRSVAPGQRLAADLPAFAPRESVGYHLADRSVSGYGQLVLIMTADVLFEEGVFRGLPLAVATTLGSFEVLFVGLGTLLWAFLHGIGRGIAITLTTGWVLAALWLSGHWELAVGLHLGTNLGLLILKYRPR